MQKLSIGRIVHYALSAGDVEQIDKHHPQQDDSGRYLRNSVREGQPFPAMVVGTWAENSANLQVSLDGATLYWATSRTEGEGPGHWIWPPRV